MVNFPAMTKGVMQAFCDETGNHAGARTTGVGGYLFTPEKATVFYEKWRDVLSPLQSRGITHLHAANCSAADREFGNLKDAERMALFHDCADLVQQTAELGIIAELERHEYRAWIASNPSISRLVGSEFAVGCVECLSYFAKWVREHRPDETIVYTFETGNKSYMDEVSAIMNAVAANPKTKEFFRFETYGFGSKGLTHPLEAADLLLWTHQCLEADHRKLPVYVGISRRGLFYKSKVAHRLICLNGTSLTFRAVFNESHGLRSGSR